MLTAAQMQERGFLQRGSARGRSSRRRCAAPCSASCALAPQAARLNKQALRALQAGASRPTAVTTLLAQAYAYADSAEHREGVSAFLAKRPADFSIPTS